VKYFPPQGLMMSWEEVKKRMRSEGTVNRVYDPDLDGVLGTVSVEALKLADNEKIYLGTDNKFSLRFDPERKAVVIRDEVNNIDVMEIKT